VTIRWFNDADRAEQARIVRERRERDELLLEFARWLRIARDMKGQSPCRS
jgi:hypothetical protein